MKPRADRLWAVGGAAGAVLLVLASWFLLVQPQQNETNGLITQRKAAEQRVVRLQAKLRTLRQQNADLPAYRAETERDRKALPVEPALSDFLRDLQTSGELAGVIVTGFNVGNPVKAAISGASVYSLAVTITAAGRTDKLRAFLDQLQKVQPRAVLIVSANFAPTEDNGTLTGEALLTLNAEIFIESTAAPAVSASPAPAATPSPSPSGSGR